MTTSATATGPGGQQINLTPDQMAAAAAQLAQVVQSGWANTLAKEPLDSPLRQAAAAAAAQAQAQAGNPGANGNPATSTIPIGAFTLPLHPHPDSPEAQAAFRAAAAEAAAAATQQQQQGGRAGSNATAGQQAPPFPSLASLQNSLLELAKMHPNLSSAAAGAFPGFPGFAMPGSPAGTNANGTQQPNVQSPTQRPATPQDFGLSEPAGGAGGKKNKKKNKGGAAAAPVVSPPPAPVQPPSKVRDTAFRHTRARLGLMQIFVIPLVARNTSIKHSARQSTSFWSYEEQSCSCSSCRCRCWKRYLAAFAS